MKAICETTGRSIRELKKDMEESGDLGSVAENSKGKQKTLFKEIHGFFLSRKKPNVNSYDKY